MYAKRPDVDVLPVLVALHQFNGDLAEFIGAVRDVQHQQPATGQQALIVLPEPEDVDEAFFLVPIAPDTLEHPGAIVESVGHYVDLGLAERHELALEECL